MSSKQTRKAILREYAKEMIANVNKALDRVEAKDPNFPKIDKVDARMRSYLSLFDGYL